MRPKRGNTIKISISVCMVMAVIMVNLMCIRGHGQTGSIKLAWKTSQHGYRWSGKSSGLGYKPVPDVSVHKKARVGFSSRQDYTGEYDNDLYREWCEETFDNGKYIYAAYKNIAFGIEYKSEAEKTDFWQTPIETDILKSGDCEDAVFLLFSELPPNQKNAQIVWGRVVDKQSKATRPHVWYQLTDKRGQKFIVEGFSKDWDGIIPVGIAKKYESRKPMLTIPHTKVTELASLLLDANGGQAYWSLINLLKPTIDVDNRNYLLKTKTKPLHFSYEFTGHIANTQDESWTPANHRMRKEIFNIFKKLHKMFLRYDEQKTEPCTYTQVSNRIDLKQISMDNNLRR